MENSNGKSNLRFIFPADAAITGVEIDLDPNIVAAKPSCSSSNSHKNTKPLDPDACDPSLELTNGNQGSNEESGTPSKPKAQTPSYPERVDDDYTREFNNRPLGENEDMNDMCNRFYGGRFSFPVCSSGYLDQTLSSMTHPHIPPAQIWDLTNCRRGMPILQFFLNSGKF